MLIVIAVILVAVGGGVWFVHFRSTPEKTVHEIIAAFEADSDDAVRLLLTESSRDKSLDFIFTVSRAARNATKPRFEVLEAMRSGDEATVPVRIVIETGAVTVAPTVNWVLVREDWIWKLDVDLTKKRALDDIISVIGG